MRGYDQRFAGARHETSLWFIQGHHRIEIADVQVLRENTGPILRLIRWNGHFARFGFGVTLVAFRVGEELLPGMNKQPELSGLVLLDFGAQPLLLFAQLGRKLSPEILRPQCPF